MRTPSGLQVLEEETSEAVALSVVIAVRDPQQAHPIPELYRDYKEQLQTLDRSFEFVFAVEGNHPEVIHQLRQLTEAGEPVSTLVFARWYGGATSLSAAFDRAEGDVILTLPAYHQIEPDHIPTLFAPLERYDMVTVRRSPRQDGVVTRVLVWTYHAIVQKLLGAEFHDLGCGIVAFRREVLRTVDLYGDQHRFLPLLTRHRGFRVKEVEAPQTQQDTFQSHLSLRKAMNRLLDLVAVFFLTRFTRKPLRFFGATGLASLVGGGGITVYLTIQRLFMGVPLKNKPMLLLGILLIVLGTLLFAIGLIGEMVIFTNSKDMKEYITEEVIE
jgi:hypothetical protein